MPKRLYHFLLTLTIGLTLVATSCKKDNNAVDSVKPTDETDSTYHVFNQRIDSGFVFGRWTFVCSYTYTVITSPPYNTLSVSNCANHPVYEFKPNGLLYMYAYNQLGDTSLIDSAMYWYRAADSNLFMLGYDTEINAANDTSYIAVGAINVEQLTYRNDSMFWKQNTGGSATALKSFVRKD